MLNLAAVPIAPPALQGPNALPLGQNKERLVPEITLNGKKITVPDGTNLIEAAKQVDTEVPHYCYHSKLSVAGNCRMCLVEIEKVPKLQIACNTIVREGMVVSTENERVKRAREQVLEFILINHPLDCPICDQAGECKLQEYYMDHDLQESRFEEPKVHKDKVTDLGPRVMLDMERCILCTRCIRFCQEIAKEDELTIAERGNHNVLTTYPGKQLENPYSGNVVDICPVGALTDKDFRFKCRVWLLKKEKSICPGCARGCNIEIHHHDNKIQRLKPRKNDAVNEDWMCDEGRDTYKPVMDDNRLRTPSLKQGGAQVALSYTEILPRIQEAIGGIEASAIVGIGSAQASNEDNYALQQFLKSAFDSSNFLYHKKEVENPTEDDFLICADKNPNTQGVEALGFKKISSTKKFKAFFVIDSVPEETIKKISLDKKSIVVMLATHNNASSQWADFVIPMTTFAETSGTFTNIDYRVQKFSKAIKAPGESKTPWQFFTDLITYFGKEGPRYQNVDQILKEIGLTHD
jgi:NADH-quinone oxidoreductase subunit G